MTEHLLTPDEVAEKLKVSRLTVMAYLRSGVLGGRKVGRLWRISEEDLRMFLEGNRRRASSRVPMVADALRRGAATSDAAAYPGAGHAPAASDALASSDAAWLEADLAGSLPPWDWGPEGRPRGIPVEYVPGVGLVIEGIRRRGK